MLAILLACGPVGCGGGGGAGSGGGGAPATATQGRGGLTSWLADIEGGGELKIMRQGSDRVEVTAGGATFVAARSGGRVTLTGPGGPVAAGKLKAEKVELAGTDGSFYALIKNRSDKLKLYLDGPEGTPWEFKRKPEKIKVVHAEQERGKVKFYPDTGKLKVKDTAGETLLQIKGADRLRIAPGLVLPERAGALGSAQRNLLMALITLLEG